MIVNNPADPSAFTDSAWVESFSPPAVRFYGQSPKVEPLRLLPSNAAQPSNFPASDFEKIEWHHSQRTQIIEPDVVPLSWLLAQVLVSEVSIGVLERVACYLYADALDENGIAVASFLCDGTDPTIEPPLSHPNPAIDPLVFRWSLRDLGYNRETSQTALTAIPPTLTGQTLRPEWVDGQFGWNSHANRMQMGIAQGTRVALWITCSGGVHDDAPGWRVRASGQLSGFIQNVGPRGAAEKTMIVRS